MDKINEFSANLINNYYENSDCNAKELIIKNYFKLVTEESGIKCPNFGSGEAIKCFFWF